jgi:hypothetical protein
MKQQHTGEYMEPGREEPVNKSSGNHVEKNQHKRAQIRKTTPFLKKIAACENCLSVCEKPKLIGVSSC